MNNKNRVALVTGASAGIGTATALKLKEAGYTVYGAARRVEKMKVLEERGIKLIKLDVTLDESMVSCAKKILKEQGRLDVLVNNAGYGFYGAMEDVPMEEARKQFDVNVFGMARLTQLFLPTMRKQGSGRIINVSSIGGKAGCPHGVWYQGSKFAVEGLSDSLRMELKQFNIDVVVIQPGAIKTEWNEIARENLLKTSGDTVYGKNARKHAANLEKWDKRGSEPEVIARGILKAVQAKRPKVRYAIGSGAAIGLFIKSILSDRMYDRFLLNMLFK
jgi:NAD(P)-dependent dehydrogenase (short-subunit alcohol dehydrogenase family)